MQPNQPSRVNGIEIRHPLGIKRLTTNFNFVFMSILKSKLQLSIVVTLLCCYSVHAQHQVVTGKVVAVADGDTLTVLDASKRPHRVRLNGIDAPERSQAFGTRARQQLSDFVFNKVVRVQIDKQDRYGKSLGKVLVGDRDINLEMIRIGLAWHYKAYQHEQSAEDRYT